MGFTHWDWDLATGNEMNNYKMGMGFLFFSVLCSNYFVAIDLALLSRDREISIFGLRDRGLATRLTRLHSYVLSVFLVSGQVKEDKNGFGKGFSQNGTRNQVRQCQN